MEKAVYNKGQRARLQLRQPSIDGAISVTMSYTLSQSVRDDLCLTSRVHYSTKYVHDFHYHALHALL
jgi:hypothetical protein